MDTDHLYEPPYTNYINLGDDSRPLRAYFFFSIRVNNEVNLDTNIITQLLRYQHILPSPYTWYVPDQYLAIIVNAIELSNYVNQSPLMQLHMNQEEDDDIVYPYIHVEPLDEDMVLRVFNMEGFQQETESTVLTKEVIAKYLKVTNYFQEEEEGEVCAICQVEFEKNEKVGELQCKHRYHPNCIKDWLVRKNVCPLCMVQGLAV